MPNTLGNSARTYIKQTENHKLRLEFEAAAAVVKGQPVKLEGGTSSKIVPWVGGTDDKHLCIGHAEKTITSANISAGAGADRVTVCMRAYAVVFGVTEANATTLAAGPATTVGVSVTSGYTDYCRYKASAAAAHYPDMVGWILDYSASGQNKVIRVALMD